LDGFQLWVRTCRGKGIYGKLPIVWKKTRYSKTLPTFHNDHCFSFKDIMMSVNGRYRRCSLKSIFNGSFNSEITLYPWKWSGENVLSQSVLRAGFNSKSTRGGNTKTHPPEHTKQNCSNKEPRFLTKCQNETTGAKFILRSYLLISQEIPRLLWDLKFVTMFTKPGHRIPPGTRDSWPHYHTTLCYGTFSYNPPPQIKSSMWSHPFRFISKQSQAFLTPLICTIHRAHLSLFDFINKRHTEKLR
jgi:hypothetical protein